MREGRGGFLLLVAAIHTYCELSKHIVCRANVLRPSGYMREMTAILGTSLPGLLGCAMRYIAQSRSICLEGEATYGACRYSFILRLREIVSCASWPAGTDSCWYRGRLLVMVAQ